MTYWQSSLPCRGCLALGELNGVSAEISVLMSVYVKETSGHLKQCFDSLLSQTVLAREWVVVEDGPLTDEVYDVLDEFEQLHPGLLLRVPLEKNQGLGPALREGLAHCTYELVARMDTDDIAVSTRFEEQIERFRQDPQLDICGGQIAEFDKSPENVIDYRNVPLRHDEIVSYQRWRSAFNHMTVMYKKESVISAGSYEDAPLMEDDVLWAHMIQSGCKCCNLDRVLVYARADTAMIGRRGSASYLQKYYNGRRKMWECGFINGWELLGSMLIQSAVALSPLWLRTLIFRTALRRKAVRTHAA